MLSLFFSVFAYSILDCAIAILVTHILQKKNFFGNGSKEEWSAVLIFAFMIASFLLSILFIEISFNAYFRSCWPIIIFWLQATFVFLSLVIVLRFIKNHRKNTELNKRKNKDREKTKKF